MRRRRRRTGTATNRPRNTLLLLQRRYLGLQQSIFAPQLRQFGSRASHLRNTIDLNSRLQAIETLDTHVEIMFQGLEFFDKVAFDVADAGFESTEEAFDGFYGQE